MSYQYFLPRPKQKRILKLLFYVFKIYNVVLNVKSTLIPICRSLHITKRTNLSILNSCIKSALPYGCVSSKEVFNDRRNLLVQDTTHSIIHKILNFEIKILHLFKNDINYKASIENYMFCYKHITLFSDIF